MSDHYPSIEHKRRLNPLMQDVLKKKIIKGLDIVAINPIAHNSRYDLFIVCLKREVLLWSKNKKMSLSQCGR